MNKFFTAWQFLKYQLSAGNAHNVHSPFVYELFNNVIHDKTPYYGFDLIESLRARHLLNKIKINIIDYGTGKKIRSEFICEVARKSLQQKKYAQLLFRLVNRFASNNILEIGTSLGISTLYLSLPDKKNHVFTLEGSPEIAALAQKNFNLLKRDNIELICGEFEESLPLVLSKTPFLDFVYFDGNHQKNATLSYFRKCITHTSEKSIFVFDDIHWSSDMNIAWEEIKYHPAVTLSIDLFQFGIVFFHKGQVKQHFTLRF